MQRIKDIIIAVLLVALIWVWSADAGDPAGPATPPDATSWYSIEDIYQRLDAGTEGSPSTFTEPSVPPATGTMHTLNEVMGKAPAKDDANGALTTEVLTGKTFWGLNAGSNEWGLQTGTAAVGADVTGADGSLSMSIPDGFYSGSKSATAQESDLAAGNIKSGVNIFGVNGSVIEATGDAAAGDVLDGKTFSNASSASVNGTMTNNAAVTITPSDSDQTIAAGYHNGSGTVTGDSNLAAGNIKSGVSIFGVNGSVIEASGDAAAGDVLDGKTFSSTGFAGVSGTMADNGAVTITPSDSNQTIPAGYHNGLGTVTTDGDLTAGNIKKDVEIFGVTGSVIEATSDATAADVLIGKTFSNGSSAGLTGTAYPAAVPKTGQTTQYSAGDDGDLEKGVAWPTPHFTANGDNNNDGDCTDPGETCDGTVTDNLTGLIWLKNANCTDVIGGVTFNSDRLNWQEGLDFAAALSNGDCGLSDGSNDGDWRLPNMRELQSLIDYGRVNLALSNAAGTGPWSEGDPFDNVQSNLYWSSSTYAGGTALGWLVNLNVGNVLTNRKTDDVYVWPVRGGQ